ncbi:MAG TPA: alpha/beta hydrolase [Anaerolineae bacterium]|nr:alpha/beta hydrolase [Anaerolineae bacterium]
MQPNDHFVTVNQINLHLRQWHPPIPSHKPPFLLVHGLASNAQTWDGVARYLAEHGHHTIAIDQRGHGLSDKPDDGYDFDQITDDIYQLLQQLGWQKPILAGQSWGGNVMISFGARYPDAAQQLICVDGGFLDLRIRGSWAEVSQALRPPPLAGTPRQKLYDRIRQAYPDWSEAGINATLANFEHLPDGTIRPWLSLENHMRILRAMYDQQPATLYPHVHTPVLFCVADDGTDWTASKRPRVEAAVAAVPQATAVWFPHTAHDIHVHRPQQLAQTFLTATR